MSFTVYKIIFRTLNHMTIDWLKWNFDLFWFYFILLPLLFDDFVSFIVSQIKRKWKMKFYSFYRNPNCKTHFELYPIYANQFIRISNSFNWIVRCLCFRHVHTQQIHSIYNNNQIKINATHGFPFYLFIYFFCVLVFIVLWRKFEGWLFILYSFAPSVVLHSQKFFSYVIVNWFTVTK